MEEMVCLRAMKDYLSHHESDPWSMTVLKASPPIWSSLFSSWSCHSQMSFDCRPSWAVFPSGSSRWLHSCIAKFSSASRCWFLLHTDGYLDQTAHTCQFSRYSNTSLTLDFFGIFLALACEWSACKCSASCSQDSWSQGLHRRRHWLLLLCSTISKLCTPLNHLIEWLSCSISIVVRPCKYRTTCSWQVQVRWYKWRLARQEVHPCLLSNQDRCIPTSQSHIDSSSSRSWKPSALYHRIHTDVLPHDVC